MCKGNITYQILQILAADRLSEVEEAQQDNINLSKQLENLQVHKFKLLIYVPSFTCHLKDKSFYFVTFQNLIFDILFAQNELNDDKYVHSSRLYNLVNDQLQHWNVEVERYKALTDSLLVNCHILLLCHASDIGVIIGLL